MESVLEDIANKLKVCMLDTKGPSGASAPTFNIYIKGDLIPQDGLWCHLCNFLAVQEYALPFQDPGFASTNLFHCSICHSVDHPHGLCKFPSINGWNGPT